MRAQFRPVPILNISSKVIMIGNLFPETIKCSPKLIPHRHFLLCTQTKTKLLNRVIKRGIKGSSEVLNRFLEKQTISTVHYERKVTRDYQIHPHQSSMNGFLCQLTKYYDSIKSNDNFKVRLVKSIKDENFSNHVFSAKS